MKWRFFCEFHFSILIFNFSLPLRWLGVGFFCFADCHFIPSTKGDVKAVPERYEGFLALLEATKEIYVPICTEGDAAVGTAPNAVAGGEACVRNFH